VHGFTHMVDVPLPADLSIGTHTLIVDLRDNHHEPLGISARVDIECVLPQ